MLLSIVSALLRRERIPRERDHQICTLEEYSRRQTRLPRQIYEDGREGPAQSGQKVVQRQSQSVGFLCPRSGFEQRLQIQDDLWTALANHRLQIRLQNLDEVAPSLSNQRRKRIERQNHGPSPFLLNSLGKTETEWPAPLRSLCICDTADSSGPNLAGWSHVSPKPFRKELNELTSNRRFRLDQRYEIGARNDRDARIEKGLC